MHLIPLRRDFRFHLDASRILNWHGKGRAMTHLWNAASVFFPVGERFFIASIRHYRDQVTDPDLQKAITAFIGQEAMHGREHEHFNELIEQAGAPALAQEAHVKKVLAWVNKTRSPKERLAITMALEHFTAILAGRILDDEAIFAGSEPSYKAMWRWHALEETEHKAVAFDVWNAVMPHDLKHYGIRARALLMATVIFLTYVFKHTQQNIASDPKVTAWEATVSYLDFIVGKTGFVRKAVPEWLDYFRPNFHPWDHDNRQHLTELESYQDSIPLAA
jgi:hypothetical protein